MRRLVDLSQPITHRGHARPFHPTPTIWTHISHEESARIWKKGGFSVMTKGFIMSDHGGTHVDAYTHIDPRPGAESIDQLPLELFMTEMIAVMLHKPNVWYELHGWSPRYLSEDLKHDIARRLQERVMFGADYPLFAYERLVRDWQGLGLDQAVLEKVFYRNAERFFATLRA